MKKYLSLVGGIALLFGASCAHIPDGQQSSCYVSPYPPGRYSRDLGGANPRTDGFGLFPRKGRPVNIFPYVSPKTLNGTIPSNW